MWFQQDCFWIWKIYQFFWHKTLVVPLNVYQRWAWISRLLTTAIVVCRFDLLRLVELWVAVGAVGDGAHVLEVVAVHAVSVAVDAQCQQQETSHDASRHRPHWRASCLRLLFSFHWHWRRIMTWRLTCIVQLVTLLELPTEALHSIHGSFSKMIIILYLKC